MLVELLNDSSDQDGQALQSRVKRDVSEMVEGVSIFLAAAAEIIFWEIRKQN